MKIYTTTGDHGETSLFGGKRVPKDAVRIEAYGTVDELNSAIGIARAWKPSEEIDAILSALQNDLFILGADLSTPGEQSSANVGRIRQEHITHLEQSIDAIEPKLKPLSSFILPDGSHAGAQLHFARTVCRRAERCVVKLSREESVDPLCIVFLNRVSDLLFILARYANLLDGAEETPWVSGRK